MHVLEFFRCLDIIVRRSKAAYAAFARFVEQCSFAVLSGLPDEGVLPDPTGRAFVGVWMHQARRLGGLAMSENLYIFTAWTN